QTPDRGDLVARAPLVALEVLEVDARRERIIVNRHDDPIQFCLLFWRGQARAAHMGGVDWPACTCGRDDPLNRATRLPGHITSCRHNDDGLVIATRVRGRCTSFPGTFRHAGVLDGVT